MTDRRERFGFNQLRATNRPPADDHRKVDARSRFRLLEKYRSSTPDLVVSTLRFHGISTRGCGRNRFASARCLTALRIIIADVMINGLPNKSQASILNISGLPVELALPAESGSAANQAD
jgi:hypothetical protein